MAGRAEIVAIGSDNPFPRAQVLDLAVSVAIGRDLATTEDEIAKHVENWFMRPIGEPELVASVARLIDRGWVKAFGPTGSGYCLTQLGVDATTTLSGGMIRLIDRGRGLLKASFLLQSLDLAEGKCS